jgi:hypothetical protein
MIAVARPGINISIPAAIIIPTGMVVFSPTVIVFVFTCAHFLTQCDWRLLRTTMKRSPGTVINYLLIQ